MSYKTFNNKEGPSGNPSVIDQLLPLRPLDWSSLARQFDHSIVYTQKESFKPCDQNNCMYFSMGYL